MIPLKLRKPLTNFSKDVHESLYNKGRHHLHPIRQQRDM